jgi:hypothetical protein
MAEQSLTLSVEPDHVKLKNSKCRRLTRGWNLRTEQSNGVLVLLHGNRASRLSMLGRARLTYEPGRPSGCRISYW